MPTSASPRRRRLLAAAALALAVLAVLPALAAAAQPGTVRLLGTEPYRSVTVTTPSGARVTTVPSRLLLRVTPDGGAAVQTGAFCADIHHYIGPGTDYRVSLRTAADDAALASPATLEAAWLAGSADALLAAAPAAARALEAGAIQIAVWQLTGQARAVAPTGDAVLDARAAEIRALAAGRAPGGAVTVAAASPRGCAGEGVAVTLTGVPGSTAELSAAGAGASVDPAQVRFGADGRASAVVTAPRAGEVTVTARSHGATLVRAARASGGQTTPQETIFAVPAATVATATTTIAFDDCHLAPFEEARIGPGPVHRDVEVPSVPGGPLSPFGRPAAPPAAGGAPPAAPRRSTATSSALRVTKRARARVAAGARLRYTIRVANRGRAALRGVEVADTLPAGVSLEAVPAGAALRAGRVVWSLRSLAPGASRTLRLTVRVDRDVAGRVCNRVRALAAGARVATATACTGVRAVRRTTAAVTA